MRYIVALTGGIGSGKTTVANAFARKGIDIIDADIISREIVEPGQPALAALSEKFGPHILLPDGALNRKALREIIFNDTEKKQWVNALLHPLVHARTQYLLNLATSPYVLWVVPLLIENGLQTQANRVLVIDVNRDVQRIRTMQRDGVSAEQAENIINAQVPREQRLSYADDIIDNNGAADTIEPRVALLHNSYLKLAAAMPRQDINKNE
jgi:dephospho-CoA kinase